MLKNKAVTVGVKAEKNSGKNFIWVLAGIPKSESEDGFDYYVIPSPIVAKNVAEGHKKWLGDANVNGRVIQDSAIRTILIPPHASYHGWKIDEYKNRWDNIEDLLK